MKNGSNYGLSALFAATIGPCVSAVFRPLRLQNLQIKWSILDGFASFGGVVWMVVSPEYQSLQLHGSGLLGFRGSGQRLGDAGLIRRISIGYPGWISQPCQPCTENITWIYPRPLPWTNHNKPVIEVQLPHWHQCIGTRCWILKYEASISLYFIYS